jgi:hypothetical protein
MADYRDVAMAGVELAVTVGIIEAAVDEPNVPDEVKENLEEKVAAVVEYLHSEVQEFQQFGEAYDSE